VSQKWWRTSADVGVYLASPPGKPCQRGTHLDRWCADEKPARCQPTWLSCAKGRDRTWIRRGAGGLPKELETRVDEVLERVGLAEFADRLPRELSGGMQSRVSLARALVHEPSVLLMDEPFAALDELTRTEMALHLLSVWERIRTTVVFITHHIEEAVLLSNQVIVMSSRPGTIRRCLKVDLPRPRSIETRRMPPFRNIVEDLVADFHGRRPEGAETNGFASEPQAERSG
jgi:ABC-type sugar transport system ATPase subunit